MKFVSEDLEATIASARILAIEWKHIAIDIQHFFVAMLKHNCMAVPYLSHCDEAEWSTIGQNSLRANGTYTFNDSLPLTVQAERLISHALAIAKENKEEKANTVYLLMALLSYENIVSEAFRRKGILFEDIAEQYCAKAIVPFTPAMQSSANVEFVKFRKMLWSGAREKQKVEQLMFDAYSYLVYYRPEECITVCKVGLTLDPSLSAWNDYLLRAYIQQRDYVSVEQLLHSLLHRFPGDRNYLLDLSYSYDVQEKYAASEVILNNLLAAEPDNADFLNNKGFNLSGQGKYEEAVPYLEKAIQINPAFAFPYNNLGFVKHKLGNSEEALRLIDQSLELDRGNSFAYKNKGIVFMDNGNREEAVRYFRLALRYGYAQKYGPKVEQLLAQLGA